jgi:hypothetical protein
VQAREMQGLQDLPTDLLDSSNNNNTTLEDVKSVSSFNAETYLHHEKILLKI